MPHRIWPNRTCTPSRPSWPLAALLLASATLPAAAVEGMPGPFGERLTIDEKGITLKFPDDAATLRIGGRLQLDFGTGRVQQRGFGDRRCCLCGSPRRHRSGLDPGRRRGSREEGRRHRRPRQQRRAVRSRADRRDQPRELHRRCVVVRTMHFLRAKDEVGEGELEKPKHVGGRPTRPRLCGSTGMRRSTGTEMTRAFGGWHHRWLS